MVALQADGLPLLEESIGAATFKKLTILELGCGCGMVGISIAQTIPDCEVLLTDMPEAQEIAERNIGNMNPAISSTATFVPFDWEAPLPMAIRKKAFDIILVSECTYNTDTIPALVQTLTALVTHFPKAIVLLATKVRHSSETLFFNLMRKTSFVKASHTKLSLPKGDELEEESEEVDVYIFHDKANPLHHVASSTPSQPVVRFWDD
jgi:predicted nicotinamide N-methyase